MSDVISFNGVEIDLSKYPKLPVVADRNLMCDRFVLNVTTMNKRAILFFHNSTIKPKDDFLKQSNEYVDGVDHEELGVAWCDYSMFASKFQTEQANDELRFCMVGLYVENQFISVKSADDFAAAVKLAVEKDIMPKPRHGKYGNSGTRPRCMCCYNTGSDYAIIRKNNRETIATLLELESCAFRGLTLPPIVTTEMNSS
ncbi:hypothetical protein IWW47_000139 [Coemansia sp. RSA 2052]|nr:hypothetical protein IWW47_000139 [Coemansia sp. RSA 2052]